eukprot:CAMPEP_0181185312 /NCGR_PEP_ID=MMETSP1096-20121128/9439_1 /TAXON_ID=156174 ORGANISM="Chrysochromulina ericina, Strain CCMP281" /NCGR_SAMPLE_ID=MMETSP1096 /ASSEMBLY_ACC=CAM_ASM_000453 /LENGTH=39 /DNA_ID= /DNA_START= /DNA_END= /DNA_ORIENTATION=
MAFEYEQIDEINRAVPEHAPQNIVLGSFNVSLQYHKVPV